MKEKPADERGSNQRTAVCDCCGKEIEENDIWYPFFDMLRCGGGIVYACARCAVDRVLHFVERNKEDLLERAAKTEKDDPLSDGLLNFFGAFPISPIHWARFYALGGDLEEIKRLVAEAEKTSA